MESVAFFPKGNFCFGGALGLGLGPALVVIKIFGIYCNKIFCYTNLLTQIFNLLTQILLQHPISTIAMTLMLLQRFFSLQQTFFLQVAV